MNNNIGQCETCGTYYCLECSTHKHWEYYCSEDCAKEAEK